MAASWPRGLRALLGMAGLGPAPEEVRRRVAGRPVVITGASRGVGACLAVRLAAVGARVLLLARDVEALAAVAQRCGPQAHTYPVDLRDADATRAVGQAMVTEHGTPAVLVHNAGHSICRTVAASTDRFHDVQRLTGVNFTGPVALTLPLLSAMRTDGAGHLVWVGSAGVGLPGAGFSTYLATKAAFEAWLRCLGPEAAADGIRISTVQLPLVRTAMSAPTRAYDRLPAMTADEAAALLCRAIVHQPRLISPWWARTGALLTAAAPGTAERVAALVDQVGARWTGGAAHPAPNIRETG